MSQGSTLIIQSVCILSLLMIISMFTEDRNRLYDDVFAQNNTTPNRGDFIPSPATSNPSLQTLNSTTPVLSRISHEGIYEVQLLWSVPQSLQSPNILPKKGFDMQIEFLDSNAPAQTDQSIIEYDLLSDELHPVPISKPLLPVTNYDIAIYSEGGDILWNQNDNSPTSGRALERVVFDEPYEGGITISITDIRSPLTDIVDAVQLPAVVR